VAGGVNSSASDTSRMRNSTSGSGRGHGRGPRHVTSHSRTSQQGNQVPRVQSEEHMCWALVTQRNSASMAVEACDGATGDTQHQLLLACLNPVGGLSHAQCNHPTYLPLLARACPQASVPITLCKVCPPPCSAPHLTGGLPMLHPPPAGPSNGPPPPRRHTAAGAEGALGPCGCLGGSLGLQTIYIHIIS
jgi:hypothetical protein